MVSTTSTRSPRHVRILFGAPAGTAAPAACGPVPGADKTSFTAARVPAAAPNTANKTSFTSALTGPGGWHICQAGQAADEA